MPEKVESQKVEPQKVEFFDLMCAITMITAIQTASAGPSQASSQDSIQALRQTPIILINAPGTIRRLGAAAIHKIFQILSQEFQVEEQIFRVDEDIAGLYQAIKLGYKNILYTGQSDSAKKLLPQKLPPKNSPEAL
jgi:hypothetical protein